MINGEIGMIKGDVAMIKGYLPGRKPLLPEIECSKTNQAAATNTDQNATKMSSFNLFGLFK